MSILLLRQSGGEWSRHELSDGTAALVQAEGRPPIAVLRGELPSPLPADTLGVVVSCGEGLFHICRPDAGSVYLNADPHPCLPVAKLSDRDRLTYHLGGGGIIRLWYRRAQPGSAYAGSSDGRACGYCGLSAAAGEEMVACAVCGEFVHSECLAHGGDSCPRCGQVIAAVEDWFPAGFCESEDRDEEDDWC
jgi:hypothetical protein